jgi:hypothetical protein
MRGWTVVPGLHVLWLTAALVACGGGGGDSSPPTAPPPGPTGLVPPAPALGAVLHADATAYRPLIAGATWNYRGVRRVGTDSPTVYENIVSHSPGAGAAMVESASNIDNVGADQATITLTAGEVRSSSTLDLGVGPPENIVDIELRSPVRSGDQITIFDKRYGNSVADLDGDGRNEALELAIYRRVIGEEFVDLVSYPQARAVRVKTFVLTRIQLSRNGEFSETESATIDTWYLEGVGVIKRSADAPAGVVDYRELTDEVLMNWNGVTQGIGFMPERPLMSPTGVALRGGLEVVSFDSHALTMSYTGSSGADGVTLSHVDASGVVQASHTYTGMNAARAALIKVGSQARVIAVTDTGVDMYFADSTGAPTGQPPVTFRSGQTLTIDTLRPVAAGAGNTFWLSWLETITQIGNERRWFLQEFDANGQSLAPALVLGTFDSTAYLGDVRAEGLAGRLVISWDELIGGQWVQRYAVLESGSTTPMVRTLTTADGSTLAARRATTSQDGAAILWRSEVIGGVSQLYGVSLDDTTGAPVRSNAQGIETERLDLSWLHRVGYFQTSSGGPRLDTFQADYLKLWPEDNFETTVMVVTELRPAGGPLATNPARVLARGYFTYADVMASLDSAVLVFGGPFEQAVVTKVWRRP